LGRKELLSKDIQFRPLAVSIHFIRYQRDQWTDDFSETIAEPRRVSFPIYELVKSIDQCTHQDRAEDQLKKAKDFAGKVNIDFNLETQIKSETIFPDAVELTKCEKGETAGKCSNPIYSVQFDDGGYIVRWKAFPLEKPSFRLYSNSGALHVSAIKKYTIPAFRPKVYALPVETTGVAGTWRFPRFIVH
jgi:hypothetical protein